MQISNQRVVGCESRTACAHCDVRHLAVCGALSPEELPRLAAITSSRRVAMGSTLIEEGEPAEDVFTLTCGMLKLYKLLPDGRRQVTGFLLPGDFIGLAVGETYIYSAEAVTPVTACRFRRPAFLGLLDELPALEKRLLGQVSTELAAAQEQMLLLGRKTARERLASFLLALARRQGVAPGRRLNLPMRRSDIADFLGVTIETVSRTFTTLRKEALISLPDKHSIRIDAPDRLAAAAGD